MIETNDRRQKLTRSKTIIVNICKFLVKLFPASVINSLRRQKSHTTLFNMLTILRIFWPFEFYKPILFGSNFYLHHCQSWQKNKFKFAFDASKRMTACFWFWCDTYFSHSSLAMKESIFASKPARPDMHSTNKDSQ